MFLKGEILMPCKDNCNGTNQEIAVCNTVFKYNLIPVDTNTHVVCVPHCLPYTNQDVGMLVHAQSLY